jgi:hypothetical protein
MLSNAIKIPVRLNLKLDLFSNIKIVDILKFKGKIKFSCTEINYGEEK